MSAATRLGLVTFGYRGCSANRRLAIATEGEICLTGQQSTVYPGYFSKADLDVIVQASAKTKESERGIGYGRIGEQSFAVIVESERVSAKANLYLRATSHSHDYGKPFAKGRLLQDYSKQLSADDELLLML